MRITIKPWANKTDVAPGAMETPPETTDSLQSYQHLVTNQDLSPIADFKQPVSPTEFNELPDGPIYYKAPFLSSYSNTYCTPYLYLKYDFRKFGEISIK